MKREHSYWLLQVLGWTVCHVRQRRGLRLDWRAALVSTSVLGALQTASNVGMDGNNGWVRFPAEA